MRTAGIDLAAQPARTAVCEVTWEAGRAVAAVSGGPVDDDDLLRVMLTADKVGVDCPLGWPDRFVDAVVAHRAGEPWPGRGQEPAGFRTGLVYRLTDVRVRERTGSWPLSVSTDRIGVVALRAAGLLDALAAAGRPVDRSGAGAVLEVYPAGALRAWGLSTVGYKRAAGREALGAMLDALVARTGGLTFTPGSEARCRRSHDAFDACVCALVARAAALGWTTGPDAGELPTARAEGWVHLPTADVGALLA